jgi:hypothetical protein
MSHGSSVFVGNISGLEIKMTDYDFGFLAVTTSIYPKSIAKKRWFLGWNFLKNERSLRQRPW